MVAPLAIAAGAQAVAGVVGGVIARAANAARGRYFSDLQLEQSRVNNYWMKRRIASETGSAINTSISRGVALEGSPLDMIMSENFNAQLQRTMQMQQSRILAERTKIDFATAGSNAMQQGFGTAINAGIKYTEGAIDNKAAR